jgi:hypothetical protein
MRPSEDFPRRIGAGDFRGDELPNVFTAGGVKTTGFKYTAWTLEYLESVT